MPARSGNKGSQPGRKNNVTLLVTNDKVDIPEMPKAEEWIRPIIAAASVSGLLDEDYEWHPAVAAWWKDIWTSPMASEFVDSDIHGLYLGCYYLHESLNPINKMSDRIAASKQFDSVVKNFGLTPSARESLKWQVAQGTAAQSRTDSLRSAARPTPGNPAQVEKKTQDLYRRNG